MHCCGLSYHGCFADLGNDFCEVTLSGSLKYESHQKPTLALSNTLHLALLSQWYLHLPLLSLFSQRAGPKDISFSLPIPGKFSCIRNDLRAFQKYYCPGPTFSLLFPFWLNWSEGDPGIGGFKTKHPKWFSPRVESHCCRPVVLELHCLLKSSGELFKIMMPR